MPCRQVSTFNGTAASSGSYTTEADCLNACKEGACCEGTTCTVKPACQCQGTGKVFKGVGTVCSPNPCLCCNANGTPKSGSGCQQCWCFCGEGAAAYPRFINVSLAGTYKMLRPIFTPVPGGAMETGKEFKDKSFSCNVTLSVLSTPSKSNCPAWMYGTGSAYLPLGTGGADGFVLIDYPTFPSVTSAQFGVRIDLRDLSEGTAYTDWKTSGEYIAGSQEAIASVGIQTSGTCFSDILMSFTAFTDLLVNGAEVRVLQLSGSITGVQA
jgi:hypothetical protein